MGAAIPNRQAYSLSPPDCPSTPRSDCTARQSPGTVGRTACRAPVGGRVRGPARRAPGWRPSFSPSEAPSALLAARAGHHAVVGPQGRGHHGAGRRRYRRGGHRQRRDRPSRQKAEQVQIKRQTAKFPTLRHASAIGALDRLSILATLDAGKSGSRAAANLSVPGQAQSGCSMVDCSVISGQANGTRKGGGL